MILLQLLAVMEMARLSLSVPQYFLGTDLQNYGNANGQCIKRLGKGAVLAMPKTKPEADAVEKLLTDSKNDLKPPQFKNRVYNDFTSTFRVLYLGATGQIGNAVWDDGSSMGPPLFPFKTGYETCNAAPWLLHPQCILESRLDCVGIGTYPRETGLKLFNIPCDKYIYTGNGLTLTYEFEAQYLCQAPEVVKTTPVPPRRTTTETSNNTTTILVVMSVCVVVLMGIGFLMYKKWTSDSDRARRRRMMLGGGDGDTDTSGLSGMSLGSSSSSRVFSLRGRSSRGSFSSFRGSSRASSRTSFGSRGSSSSLGSRGSRGSRRSKSSFSSTGSRGSKRSFRARGSSTSVGTEM